MMLKEIRELIDQWDPLNYYPENKYGIESIELIKCVKFSSQPLSIELIYSFINSLFRGMYDPDKRCNKSSEETLVISTRIYEIMVREQ